MTYIPNQRVSFHDRDNFIRDLVTILTGAPGESDGVRIPSPLSRSVRDVAPVLTLDEIKMHLRIEPAITDEDAMLMQLEMAARLHTQNVLRRDIDATVGENVKVANLLLIAHWYRNRESTGGEKLAELPLAYGALLFPERDYSANY